MWAECEHFAACRSRLVAKHDLDVDAEWWLLQPKVTAKSGWICLSAHQSPSMRARLQVASCELGVYVMTQFFIADAAVATALADC